MRERRKNHEYIFSTDDMYAVDMRRFDELTELIRCKDCKYYVIQYCEGFGDGYYVPELGYCHNAELVMRSDEYCSMAERKDE